MPKEIPDNTPPRERELAEREQREIQLVQLWQQGQGEIPKDCVALLGTSLETAEVILETGFMPGVTDVERYTGPKPKRGDVYFYPIGERFPFELVIDESKGGTWQEERPLYQAMSEEEASPAGLASDIAQAHRFLALLNQPLSKHAVSAETFVRLFDSADPDDAIDFQEVERIFRPLMPSGELIQQFVLEARQRRGIIMGIKRDAFTQYPPRFTGEDMLFKPDAPFLNLTSHVKDAGQETYERQYFSSLYEKHKAKLEK